MKTFMSEKDVRAFMRTLPGTTLFAEAAAGGTEGYPDAFYAGDLWASFFELKLGTIHKGELRFKAPQSQIRVIESLMNQGVFAFFLIGIEATKNMAITPASCIEPVGGPSSLDWNRLNINRRKAFVAKRSIPFVRSFDEAKPRFADQCQPLEDAINLRVAVHRAMDMHMEVQNKISN